MLNQRGDNVMSAQKRLGRDGLETKEVWRPRLPAIFSSPHSHSEGSVYLWLQGGSLMSFSFAQSQSAGMLAAPITEQPKH